jgi:hypothetical protein
MTRRLTPKDADNDDTPAMEAQKTAQETPTRTRSEDGDIDARQLYQ